LNFKRAAWYKLAISAEEPSVLPQVADLLKTQGRMKYLRPLYRALFRSNMGRDLALKTFSEVRASYHPIAQKMVAADLGL
jgi:leukotriene-A4 hydrolase